MSDRKVPIDSVPTRVRGIIVNESSNKRCILLIGGGIYQREALFRIFPYETSSAVAALQNGFKKRYKRAVKGLAAAVANFGFKSFGE